MRLVIVYRDGIERLRIPVEIKGKTLRNSGNILLNVDLIPVGKKAWVASQVKKGNITKEIEAMGMQIGDNGNGLIVRWADDVRKEEGEIAKDEYNALPIDVRAAREELAKIDLLFAKSASRINDTDDCNVMDSMSLKVKAQNRLEAWKVKYPDAAKEKQAASLLRQADHKKDMALGALIHDSDGWLDKAARQKRHDDFIMEATELSSQAKALK